MTQLGAATVNALVAHGEEFEVIAMVRNPAKATTLRGRTGVTIAQGDMNDKESIKNACKGAFGFFFYCPNALSIGFKAYTKYLQNSIAAAKECGVSCFIWSSGIITQKGN
jgi:uncharacterized protein YbjT (DUF2867 family)